MNNDILYNNQKKILGTEDAQKELDKERKEEGEMMEEELVKYIKEKERTNWAVYIFDIMNALKLDRYDVIELIDECIANERIELRVLKNDQR